MHLEKMEVYFTFCFKYVQCEEFNFAWYVKWPRWTAHCKTQLTYETNNVSINVHGIPIQLIHYTKLQDVLIDDTLTWQ